jgi:hypothetical protein
VETTSRALQTSEPEAPKAGPPVKWLFKVSKREKVTGRDCFRVEVSCESDPELPKTIVWVDEKSATLRQVESTIVVGGEARKIKDRFDHEEGSPSPVISSLTALPLDLPLFSTVRPRSGKYGYKSIVVDDDKPSEGMTFAVEVDQKLTPANVAVARGLLGESEVQRRDGAGTETYEVVLKSPEREVKQLWKPGMPWPSYSQNGSTTARLIKVLPPTGGR